MSEAVITLKNLHSKQQYILDTAKRFNVLKCGRRFGKTALAEELVIDPALDGYPTAFYAPTYKDLSDFWYNIKQILHEVIETKNEQTKQLRLITGGLIDFWSLDEPDSGRGRKYKRVVIDECEKAKKIEEAWKGTIRATLTDFQGDCWFLSTPKFGNTFFKEMYELSLKPEFEHEWKSWQFTTYDNPHIKKEEVDAARRTLDDLYFRCEYLAEDVNISALMWAFAFDKSKHVSKPEIKRNEILYLSFDFNKNPITCSVIQWYEETVKVIECIKLENSDIYALCDYILVHYPQMLYMVTGDATGKNTSALVKDNLNYYIVIRQKLGVSNNQLMIPSVNPRLEDNQVLVNSILANYKVEIHEEKAKHLIFDLMNVRTTPEGGIEKSNRQDKAQQADALDTFRYFCNTYLQNFLNFI